MIGRFVTRNPPCPFFGRFDTRGGIHRMPTPLRLLWADILRIAAACAVVAIHISAPVVVNLAIFESGDWWAGNVMNSSVRWAVPGFAMLAGALLLDPGRIETAGVFYRRRMRRVHLALGFLACIAIVAIGAWMLCTHYGVMAGPRMLYPPPWLMAFGRWGFSANNEWPVVGLIGLLVVTLVVSYARTLDLSRMPVLRRSVI